MTDPIEHTVDRLRAELGGVRGSLLTEVRDGLEDAATAYADAGLAETEARRRAVADFGAPAQVAEHYRTTELGRRSLRLAALLAGGFTSSLLVWAAVNVGQGRPVTLEGANLGFALVTALAVGTAVLGGWWTRSQLRRGESPRTATLAVAAAALALCAVTWLLSYAAQPWTTPADVQQTGWQWHHTAEALSALVTLSMLGMALRCLAGLRSSYGVRCRDEPAGATGPTAGRRPR